MNQENSLIRLSQQELSLKYQVSLKEQYQELKELKKKLAYQKVPLRTGFDSFLMSLSLECSRLEQEEREQLMRISELEILELAEKAFQTQTQQLITWTNETIKSVVDNKEIAIIETKKEIVEKNIMLSEQNTQIENYQLEINKLKRENDNLLFRIDKLREIIQNNQPNKTNEHSSPVDSGRLILDTSTLTIQQLKEEYGNLLEENKSLVAKIKEIQNEHFLLEDTVQDLTDKIIELQLEDEQTIKVQKAFQDEKEQLKKALAEWKTLNQKNIDKFNKNALEKAQLKAKVFELEQTIEQGLKYIQQLEKELNNHLISLEIKEKNLKELAKLNFESKLKLQSLLFLDTMRSFTPEFFGKGLTTVETSIFISNVTNYPKVEKAGWTMIFLFLIISVIANIYKILKFTIFKGIDFFLWMRGKNYPIVDLEDKEVQTNENNKLEQQLDPRESKSSQNKKK